MKGSNKRILFWDLFFDVGSTGEFGVIETERAVAGEHLESDVGMPVSGAVKASETLAFALGT